MECGAAFSSYNSALRHHRTAHCDDGGQGGRPRCSICDREYKNTNSLDQHLRTAHAIYQSDLPKKKAARGGM